MSPSGGFAPSWNHHTPPIPPHNRSMGDRCDPVAALGGGVSGARGDERALCALEVEERRQLRAGGLPGGFVGLWGPACDRPPLGHVVKTVRRSRDRSPGQEQAGARDGPGQSANSTQVPARATPRATVFLCLSAWQPPVPLGARAPEQGLLPVGREACQTIAGRRASAVRCFCFDQQAESHSRDEA